MRCFQSPMAVDKMSVSQLLTFPCRSPEKRQKNLISIHNSNAFAHLSPFSLSQLDQTSKGRWLQSSHCANLHFPLSAPSRTVAHTQNTFFGFSILRGNIKCSALKEYFWGFQKGTRVETANRRQVFHLVLWKGQGTYIYKSRLYTPIHGWRGSRKGRTVSYLISTLS